MFAVTLQESTSLSREFAAECFKCRCPVALFCGEKWKREWKKPKLIVCLTGRCIYRAVFRDNDGNYTNKEIRITQYESYQRRNEEYAIQKVHFFHFFFPYTFFFQISEDDGSRTCTSLVKSPEEVKENSGIDYVNQILVPEYVKCHSR